MPLDNEHPRLYPLQEASRLLGGYSVWTLRKHISQGTISPVRLGSRVFLSSELIAQIQRDGLPPVK
jgi:hypothetical protein